MHRFCVVLAALASLAVAGCPMSTTAPSTVPIEDLGARFGATSCGILTDCYGDAIRNAFLGTTSEADCAAQIDRQYRQAALPQYQEAIANGTMSYDGAQVAACIAAIEAQGCATVNSRTPAACDRVLIGEVMPGAACSVNEQCAGDAYCMNTTACPGTCQPRGAVGTTCTTDEACQSGMKCTSGSCAVPGADGAPCRGPAGNECAGGLICTGAEGMTTPGTCRSVETVESGALHGACNVRLTQLCQPGLSCVVTGLTSQTCETGGLTSGMPCHIAVPESCASGLFCSGTNVMTGDLDGTCAALPGAGMPCATVLFGAACGTGLRCDTGTCHAMQDAGGTCITGADCYSQSCSSGTCATAMLCR